MRLTSSTHPTPGEDIHHTVISCVSYPNPAGDGAYGFTLSILVALVALES